MNLILQYIILVCFAIIGILLIYLSYKNNSFLIDKKEIKKYKKTQIGKVDKTISIVHIALNILSIIILSGLINIFSNGIFTCWTFVVFVVAVIIFAMLSRLLYKAGIEKSYLEHKK